jgi:hypothetical protein
MGSARVARLRPSRATARLALAMLIAGVAVLLSVSASLAEFPFHRGGLQDTRPRIAGTWSVIRRLFPHYVDGLEFVRSPDRSWPRFRQ